jgi:hypothetical protein
MEENRAADPTIFTGSSNDCVIFSFQQHISGVTSTHNSLINLGIQIDCAFVDMVLEPDPQYEKSEREPKDIAKWAGRGMEAIDRLGSYITRSPDSNHIRTDSIVIVTNHQHLVYKHLKETFENRKDKYKIAFEKIEIIEKGADRETKEDIILPFLDRVKRAKHEGV